MLAELRKLTIGMTEKEREAMEAIINNVTMTDAARELGMPLNTLSQRIMRIKLKARRYELWLREFERLKLQLPPKYVG